jgi:hypothetical protein
MTLTLFLTVAAAAMLFGLVSGIASTISRVIFARWLRG